MGNTLGLDLDAMVRGGRRPAPVSATLDRELSEEDVARLAEPGSAPPPVPIQRVTERHHALAKCLAMGMTDAEAAASTGYDNARISVLKGSPAFRELVSLYMEKKDREFINTAARLAGLAHDAVAEIQRRVEDEPDELSVGQLVEIAKLATDRSGFGPSTKSETKVTIDIAGRLEEARRRAKAVTLNRIDDQQAALFIEDAQIIEGET